jgi:hypothetical protein
MEIGQGYNRAVRFLGYHLARARCIDDYWSAYWWDVTAQRATLLADKIKDTALPGRSTVNGFLMELHWELTPRTHLRLR